MNKNELEAAMKRHGDTGATLSVYLGIARSTFSAKINETNGAEFTQGEISLIKKRYALDANAVDVIFLAQKCHNKTLICYPTDTRFYRRHIDISCKDILNERRQKW